MPKISIILPVYNVEKYLEECLDSLLNQDYQNFEILLINDGSKDNSSKICKKYSELYENVIHIDKKNGGVSSARNLGIENANGKFLWFVDPDDIVAQDSLNELDKILIDDNVLYIFGYKKIYKNLEENFNLENDKLTSRDAIRNLMEEDKFCGYVWNKVFSKKIIEKYNLRFDEKISMNEDMKFCFEYLKNCKSAVCIDKIMYFYRCRTSSAINKSIGIKHASSLLCYKYIMDNTDDECVINKCKNYYLRSYYKYRKFVDISFFDIELVESIIKENYKNFKLNDKLKISMYKYSPNLRNFILKIKNFKKIYFE